MLIVIIIQKIKAFTLFAIHSWIWHWLVIEIKKIKKRYELSLRICTPIKNEKEKNTSLVNHKIRQRRTH